ncbi:MAG: peptide chain release factor N(5)-glutamine methyltransferase [Clostridia bacterium]|nr:peptide chain release factor N(5)-glutamine methyltransferase [Clostridia bacterium]
MDNNTIFNAYNRTKKQLEAAGIEDFGFESREIIRHITGFDNKKIMLNYNTRLTDIQQKRLDEIVSARVARYPLQYILGTWSFYGLSFKVGKGVLIPRADTEIAVDMALELIKDKKEPKVLDLCAGSGAIGISIAINRPEAKVTMLEKYDGALLYLKENITLNNANNASCLKGDVLESDGSGDKYDLIISNPPYIKEKDMETLQPEVKAEPIAALYGGEDGLDFYRAITANYKASLTSGGSICFEVGFDEAESVKEILNKAGFSGITVKKDLSGTNRVVFGTVN